MTRRYYSSDLTNQEWVILEPLIPPPKPGGRPCRWERREIVNAILYVLRSGGIWRLLPHDFPPWQTVYHSFRLWRKGGTWERVHTRLREQARRRAGRETTPSAAMQDAPVGQDDRKRGPSGYDGGKKVKGRKRQRHGGYAGLPPAAGRPPRRRG